MGYFAITSNQPLEVAKTSETIFINNSATYTFYEMEVVSTVNADVFPRGKYILTMIIPGRISMAIDGNAIYSDQEFLPWYYSQKRLKFEGSGNRFIMNGKYTKVIDPKIERKYDKKINISTITIEFNYDDYDGGKASDDVSSIHLFFTAACKGQVVKQKGNIFVESRYFDKKLCPRGDYFDTQVLNAKVIYVKSIYCWFIVPKGYIASDYSDFEHSPRDARIIEREYNILLNNRNWLRRKFNLLTDIFMGRPQVINWKIKDKITFNDDHSQFGKWNEIRLFVSCTGFPLTTLFWYVTGVSSIIGLLVTLIPFKK